MSISPVERAFRGAKSDAKLYILSVFSVAVAFVCLASALLVVVNVQGLKERCGAGLGARERAAQDHGRVAGAARDQ
jgi:hypothetical protein